MSNFPAAFQLTTKRKSLSKLEKSITNLSKRSKYELKYVQNEAQNTQCLKITEKGLIQHCERSELRLHFEWTKVH